jgi:hypothetical protein
VSRAKPRRNATRCAKTRSDLQTVRSVTRMRLAQMPPALLLAMRFVAHDCFTFFSLP